MIREKIKLVIVTMALILICASCSCHCGQSGGKGNKSEQVKSDPTDDIDWRYFCPCTGVVLDAQTGKPIEGAQVMAKAYFSGGMGIELGSETQRRFTQTDSDGKYYIPQIRSSSFPPIVNSMFDLIVYKAGYVACRSGGHEQTVTGPIRDYYKDAIFKYNDNTVLLEKWDDKKLTRKDHVEHVDWMGCGILDFGTNAPEESRKYCREAREEMILACMARYEKSKYPRTREECEGYTDPKLGL